MSLLGRVGAWLLDPPEQEATFLSCAASGSKSQECKADPPPSPVAVHAWPLIAVVGLAPGCGTTTLARALAATLARRDHSGTAIVAGPNQAPGSNLAARSATRLAALIASGGAPTRAAGRLCLTTTADYAWLTQLAPVVLDLRPGDQPQDAQRTILVAPGDSEPALAELAARTLTRDGREPLVVVTNAGNPERWRERALLSLPQSRIGARRAAAGWEPGGALGAAANRLAEAACA